MNGLLLDTCAVIWTGLDAKVDDPGKSAINAANAAGDEIAVSTVTALELGMLASRGKPKFPVDPKVWFHKYMERSGARLIDMAPDVLVDSCFLPGVPPKDPFDRIVIATARHEGLTIVTRDKAILAYGASGHVRTLAC